MNDNALVAKECYVSGSGRQEWVCVNGGEGSSVELGEIYVAMLARKVTDLAGRGLRCWTDVARANAVRVEVVTCACTVAIGRYRVFMNVVGCARSLTIDVCKWTESPTVLSADRRIEPTDADCDADPVTTSSSNLKAA